VTDVTRDIVVVVVVVVVATSRDGIQVAIDLGHASESPSSAGTDVVTIGLSVGSGGSATLDELLRPSRAYLGCWGGIRVKAGREGYFGRGADCVWLWYSVEFLDG